MKDLAEMIKLMAEASKAADATFESCNEHAKKTLSKEQYETYRRLMEMQTDLLQRLSRAGMINVFSEMLATLNRIMVDATKLDQGEEES